jgi:hypothetical protein
MTVTTPWPYFVLSACMIGVVGVLARTLRLDTGKLNVPLESLHGLLATSVLFGHAHKGLRATNHPLFGHLALD